MPRRKPVVILLALANLFVTSPGTAGPDHDEISRLRRAGIILSLDAIIANHRRQHPGGKLLEAELEFEQGRHIYDLKILGDDGVVREFEYDAGNGELWHLEPQEDEKD